MKRGTELTVKNNGMNKVPLEITLTVDENTLLDEDISLPANSVLNYLMEEEE